MTTMKVKTTDFLKLHMCFLNETVLSDEERLVRGKGTHSNKTPQTVRGKGKNAFKV